MGAQQQRFMKRLSIAIADGLTNPDKLRELNRLFALKPSTEKAVLITSLMLGQVSAGAIELSGADRIPPVLQQTQPQPRRSVLDDLQTL